MAMNENIQKAVIVITSLLFIAGVSEIAMRFYYQRSKASQNRYVCKPMKSLFIDLKQTLTNVIQIRKDMWILIIHRKNPAKGS